MKIVTYRTNRNSIPRTGVLVGRSVIDLNLAYVLFLDENSSEKKAYHEADSEMPVEMTDLFYSDSLNNGKARESIDFLVSKVDQESGIKAPRGEEIVHRLGDVQLMAPVLKPNSIRDTISFEGHMKNFEKRTKKPIPDMWYKIPAYYKGNPSTVVGPDAQIEWPGYTEKLDYELEFGIYIGRKGKNIKAAEAQKYIAGYTIFNDFSARDAIQREVSVFLGPSKGKDFDTGNVMGPCLVTPDEINPEDLEMEARINGKVWSKGNSSDMYWRFPQIIEYVSRCETLYPGDFIGSGTICNGCGDEMDRWLEPGDVVELEVEGIGILRNQVSRERY